MKKYGEKIIAALVVLLAIAGIVFIYEKNVNTLDIDQDEVTKVKEEFEKLNNTTRESDGAKYNNVTIKETANINIVSVKEALDLINNGTGILYVAAPWCPWCRNSFPVLIDVAEEENVVINYLDLSDVRNIWAVEDGKLVKTQEEQDGYYDLLKALDSLLDDETYKVTDSKGKEYDTNEKRIYMPSLITIKDGKLKDIHVGTVDLDENQTKYDSLTTKQKEELTNKYKSMIESIK